MSSPNLSIAPPPSLLGGQNRKLSFGSNPPSPYLNNATELTAEQRRPRVGKQRSNPSSSDEATTSKTLVEDSYFDEEKYPPRRSPPSVNSPLLNPEDTHDSNEVESARKSFRSSSGSSYPWLSKTPYRIHPCVLLPAFICGVLLAQIGIFGSRSGKKGAEFLKNSYSVGPGNDDTLRSPTEHPRLTLHSSGHLFLHPSSLHPASPSSPLPLGRNTLAAPAVHHPIIDLIANATLAWKTKLGRQSRNINEAAREYKRRYKMDPPKGFDQWFIFAQSNNVILLDEFDGIMRDIKPFFALSPSVIKSRGLKLQKDNSTFTMEVRSGDIEITGNHRLDGRAADQKKLMTRWSQWVADINITMSAHDGPSILLGNEFKEKHETAAAKGVVLSEEESSDVFDDASMWGFPMACANNSRLRRYYDGLETENLPPGPSYVADHFSTMDLCKNPEWQYLHGFTAWPGSKPGILRPLFSFSRTTLHSDILLTPLEQFNDLEAWDPPFADKPYNRAFWRGSTTGVWFDRTTWWRSSQRVRLFFMGKDKTGERSTRFDGVGVESPGGVESIVERVVPTSTLVDRYLDFAFSGHPEQCTEKDGSCDAVKKIIDFTPTVGWNVANEYKYMLDIDGNAWSGRFHRLLSTNSVVLKSTIFPEWYSGWIQPWVHYVPIKIDYTDLFDVMAFFSGDLEGRNGREKLAEGIAMQGKEYAKKHWRREDMEAYFFRLALEWARCTAEDRSTMDYFAPDIL